MKAKSKIMKAIKYTFVIIVILLITGFLGFLLRLQMAEFFYNLNASPKNLVNLAVLSVEMNDEERIERYVPKALELDEFISISVSSRIYLSSLTLESFSKDSELAYRTYYRLMIEFMMIPFYNEDYDEFQRRFRYLFPQMAKGEVDSYVLRLIEWSDFFMYSEKFSNKEYNVIVESLNCLISEPFEVLEDNIPEAYQRAYTNMILSYLYFSIGDENKSEVYEKIQWDLLREIVQLENE